MAAIRFISIQKTLGYDPAPDASANPVPFQMVPRYGARGMILHNAPKHTVELVPATILAGGSNDITVAGTGKFIEVPGTNANQREIWVSGFTEGTMFLAARNPSTGLIDARMECFIAERKKVRVGFYIVTDAANRKSTLYTASKAKSMVEGANDILYYQANVVIEHTFAKEPFPDANAPDLGKTPIVDHAFQVLDKRIDPSRNDASFHVVLLWALEDTALGAHGMTPLGVTRGATCMMKDSANPEIILAHEICHGFGLSKHNEVDSSNLMYKVAAGGTKLGRAQIIRFNRFVAAGN
jgi:hypothetical protein